MPAKHGCARAGDLLIHDFAASTRKSFVGDRFHLMGLVCYVAFAIDLYSRAIVG